MSELNKKFPEILLAYIGDVGCEFSNSRLNELSKFVSELELEIARLTAENARLIVEVKESNSLLRSSYQIALRDGNKTNWEAFRNQLHLALIRQHEIMYPKDENETRCKTL